MENGDYADRARTARVRDRATWVVAAVSAATTTCAVAATLGLAAALPVPPPEPVTAPAGDIGGTGGQVAPGPDGSPTPVPESPTRVPESPPPDARALRAPDKAPTERRSSTRPARQRQQSQQQDAPRTSGS